MTSANSIFPITLLLALSILNTPAFSLFRSRDIDCGINGYNKATNAYYVYNKIQNAGSYTICSMKCKADSDCKSFAYSTSICLLYNVPVIGNFVPMISSPYIFYDINCVFDIPPSSSTAVAQGITPTTLEAPPPTVTPPRGCSVPKSYTVSSFIWHNSSHNLDCVNGPDVGDVTGCYNTSTASSGGMVVCDPRRGPCESCGINVCNTGLPGQPLGYGPPDKVSFTIDTYGTCSQSNPQGYRRTQIGKGYVGCGTAADILNFYGDSTIPNAVGSVDFHPPATLCTDGKTNVAATYSLSFTLSCSYDNSKNATCTTGTPFKIPLTGYTTYKI